MKNMIKGKILRDPGIIELIRKFGGLKEQTKKYHEIFFAINLNVFKKYETEGGK